jgi:hypothetical protein
VFGGTSTWVDPLKGESTGDQAVVVLCDLTMARLGRVLPFQGVPFATGIRPLEASRAADRYVRNTSILLKNSNFGLDHNSEDRWQPQWKFP